jgi:hypothetical protein
MKRMTFFAAILLLWAGAARAQDSMDHAARATSGLFQAGGDLAASGVQMAVSVAVIPVGAAGLGSAAAGSTAATAGRVLDHTAQDMSTAAGESAAVNAPLPVTRRVIVAPQPPPHVPYDAQPAAPR